jgi:recombination protein RecT
VSTELVKVDPPQVVLRRLLVNHQDKLRQAIPTSVPLKVERVIGAAVNALTQSKWLQDCSMLSICNSVFIAAQLGLEPNTPLQFAYLIPYKGVCTFQLGYRGLIELAHRSGAVSDVYAHAVFENDRFSITYGDDAKLIHEPALRNRGEVIGFYSFLQLTDGTSSHLWMPIQDIIEIRDKCSKSDREDSPWKRWFNEMAAKTVLKRHLKTKRLSSDTLTAITYDNESDVWASTDHDKFTARKLVAQDLAPTIEADESMREEIEEAGDKLRGSKERQDQLREQLNEEAKRKLDAI